MLGLIKAFSDIYERHPEARLFIVGYGQGEKQVKDALSRLPEPARSQVVLTGPLSPEQLKTKMLSCHLTSELLVRYGGGLNAPYRLFACATTRMSARDMASLMMLETSCPILQDLMLFHLSKM